MQSKTFAACALSFLAGSGVLFGVGYLQPENPGKKYAEQYVAKASDPAAMQKWMEANQTGVAHEFLATMEGEYDCSMRMWMDPSAPPMEFQGSATFEMIMDGRFLKQDFRGNMMGQEFTGMGLSGYNNMKGLFNGVWIDSMSTGMGISYGNLDRTGTILTTIGNMDEPATGEMGKPYKQMLHVKDKDSFTFEMWEILYGDPFKVFEIEYTRKGV